MKRALAVTVLLLQLLASTPRTISFFPLAMNPDSGVRMNWTFTINASGSTEVTVIVTNIVQSEITFDLPKTYNDLRISPPLNHTVTPKPGYSWDELGIQCGSVNRLNFSYTWPDGAVEYQETFYFAGQEKPYVTHGNLKILLPTVCSVSWIEGYSDFAGNLTDELNFKIDFIQPVPSFSYTFEHMPKSEVTSKSSEHITLKYYKIMAGAPWIDKTLGIVESQWSWLKNTLNGTLDHVEVAFAPYGYNDLGTKKDGLCYYNSRNIEVVATKQFEIGLNADATALVLHELSHAFTPLFEDLPAFYSEAIAQDLSYDALRRTYLNTSADGREEDWFNCAYEYGVQGGFLDYIWHWYWGDAIYNNEKITWACYGTVTFIGDYITHKYGYSAYNRLDSILNKTEIDTLYGDQKLAKFVEYLSEACGRNMTKILNTLPFLITRWFDAYNLRIKYHSYKLEVTGPFTASAQPEVDEMTLNATEEYNNRNYEDSIQKFNRIAEYVQTLRSQDASFWQNLVIIEFMTFVLIVLAVFVLHYRRRPSQSEIMHAT